jgi:hypothetical protein
MHRFLLTLMAFCICVVTNAQSDSHPGYYYDISGQKISGIITFQPGENYIGIRTEGNAKFDKVDIKNISSVILNYGGTTTDSLPVLTIKNSEKHRYLAKPYFATPTVSFYYRTITLYRPTTGTGYMSPYQVEMIMYKEGNTTYELTKGNYIDVLSKAFVNDPKLVAHIRNKEFDFKHLYEMFHEYHRDTFGKEPETIKLDSSGLVK